MELNEFITATLKQIIQGVADAQEFAIENDARVNPTEVQNLGGAVVDGCRAPLNHYRTENIEFDVAVTAIEGKETKGKIGIATGILTLGSDGQSNSKKQSMNHIKFSVPIQLPSQEEKPKR